MKTHREIRVNSNNIPRLINENWEAVLRKDYLKWSKSLQHLRHAPPEVSIVKADYYAKIEGDKIIGGRVKFEIHNRSGKSRSLTLDPLNFHLDDLEIESHKIVWGSGSDGKTSLLAPPGRSLVTGRWNISGQRLFPSISSKVFRYQFDLPQATSASLTFQLPHSWTLKSDSGITREPLPNDKTKSSLWKIDLGRSSQCEVTVMSNHPEPVKKTVMFSESDTTYNISQSGLVFQHRVQLEILKNPIVELSFLVPDGLTIASVSLGNDNYLSMKKAKTGNSLLHTISFREAKLGKIGPITFTGYSDYPLNREWLLPEIRLQNVVEKNLRTHLFVENPVQILDLHHRGFLQTDISMLKNQQSRRSYRKIFPDAKMILLLDKPSSRSQVEIFTHYNIQSDELRSESLVRWSAKNGSSFNLTWSLSKGWDVVAVEVESRDGKITPANWFYRNGSTSTTRLLQIDAGRVVVPNEPILLRLTCRRSIRNQDIPMEFHFPAPVGADVLLHLMGISTTPTFRFQLSEKNSWRKIASTEIPDDFLAHPVVQRVLTTNRDVAVPFYISIVKEKLGSLHVLRSEANYRASADISVRREVDRITERCQIFIEPVDQAVQSVVLYSSQKDHGYSWQFHDPQVETPTEIQFSILDPSLHARWNVPSTGVLMELRLPVATNHSFGIVGTTSRTASLVETPSLIFLPSALDFRGGLQFMVDTKLRIQPITRLLQSSRKTIPKQNKEIEKPFRDAGSWKYSDPAEGLSVNVLNPGQNIAISASVFLESEISDSDAYHIHTASYHLNASIFSGTFEFQLDSDCELLSLSLNGNPVGKLQKGTLLQFPSLPANQQNNIIIRYRQLARKVRWNQKLTIPLPSTSLRLLGIRWKLHLSPGLRLSGIPESFRYEVPHSSPGWRQRFFGPLQVKNNVESSSATASSQLREHSTNASTIQKDSSKTLVLVSAFVPPDLTITLQSQSTRASILFGLLLLGLFLGMITKYYFLTTRSRAILSVTILLMLLTTMVLPEQFAQYCGAILFGIVLSLLLKIGNRGAEFCADSENQFGDDFSGFRLKTPVRLTALLIVITYLSGSLWAINGYSSQNFVSELQNALLKDEEFVLIPFVESSGKEIPLDIVYMKKTLKQRLQRESKTTQQNRYFIASASYLGTSKTENAIKTVAKLKVFLLESVGQVEIHLPFEGFILESENSCLVDGKPYSLRRSESGAGYTIDYINTELPKTVKTENTNSKITKHKEIEIELRFRIPVRTDDFSKKISMKIPAIADSTISFDFNRTYSTVELSLDGKIVPSKMENQNISANFGPATELSLFWNNEQKSQQDRKPTSFEMNSVVDVSPSTIQVSNSLKTEKLTEAISWFVLRIPSHAILRNLKANSLKAYYPLHMENDVVFVAVEFKTPQFSIEDFVWNYEIPRDVNPQIDRITIPKTIFQSPLDNNFKNHNHVVGFASGLEYRLRISKQPSVSWSALHSDDLQAEALKFLSPVTPTAIYVIDEPTKIVCELTPQTILQEVTQKQSFRFRGSTAQWTLIANLRSSGQRNFRFSVNIDPRLKIESVSLLKDDVERLARWNRLGNQLNLILNESLLAPLTVVIKGSIPFETSQAFHFPKISWDQLDIAESAIEISYSTDLVLDTQSSDLPERIRGVPELTLDSEWWYWGIFRTGFDDGKLKVTFLPLKKIVKTEILTNIESVSAQKFRIHNVLWFSGLKKLRRDFEVPIPKVFSENVKVRVGGVDVMTRISEFGERSFVIDHVNLDEDRTIVSIISEFDHPVTGSWKMPLFQLVGLPFAKRYLAVDSTKYHPTQKSPFTIRETNPPQWIPSSYFNRQTAQAVFEFQTTAELLSLDVVPKRSASENKIVIPLAELSLWTNSKGEEEGLLRLHLLTREAETLAMVIPKSIQPHTLLVNRHQIPIPASEVRIREIPLDSSLERQLIEIYWQRNHTSSDSLLSRRRHEIPFPDGIPATRTLTNLILPDGTRTFSLDGSEKITSPERLLQRFEGFAEMGYGQPQSGQNREYDSIKRELIELLQNDENPILLTNDFRERFEKIVSQSDVNAATKTQLTSPQKEFLDRISVVTAKSGSGIYSGLDNHAQSPIIEYRLWNDTATRVVTFAVILLIFVPAIIWILRKPWIDRLEIPYYLRTCLVGATGLMTWQWEWLGIALLFVGLLQLAVREKRRRLNSTRRNQQPSLSETSPSTVSF